MRKITVAAIVLLVVGFAGWTVIGVRAHKCSLPAGRAIAAPATGSMASAPAASKPSDDTDAKQPVKATSKPAEAQPATTRPADDRPAKSAMAAMRRAADANRHLFVFVQEEDGEQTRSARKTFDAALGKLGEKAQAYTVYRSAASERDFVAKFGLQAAPMPIVLVFAPNGAIVAGLLGSKLGEQQLLESLASPAKQHCLKALQDRKLVFLCAQNGATKSNDAAMKGVNDFKADARFANFTEIVTVNPTDEGEQQFLGQLQIDLHSSEATTVFLAPPGAMIAKFTGATTKDALVSALQKASASCSGASGCCPPRK